MRVARRRRVARQRSTASEPPKADSFKNWVGRDDLVELGGEVARGISSAEEEGADGG